MVAPRVWKGLLAIAVVSIVLVGLVEFDVLAAPWTADEGEVRVTGDEDDEPKAVVEVEVADTARERYTGLSDHDSLENGTGMLFVHDEEAEHTYVMRKMDFDIDIVFIDADGEITTIHHARAPEEGEDGNDLRYPGRGKWVLEVPRGYANETGIEAGDEVEIDLDSNEMAIGTIVEGDAQAEATTGDSAVAVDSRSIAARPYFGS
ncbi:DUF192 domain-containing protein [Halosolutus gelatinilyticus]|uniref:DUF192 domain-containing protein n=1 Tax=Halosolutus gelatinilyticus TaxID=2931975 RepID=UPI001FF458C9|nr:DUF192 domain-containing protein [Halosolutus gelatinilyticus]